VPGIAVMFRSSLARRRGAACGADRTDTSASFIESGAYLKEFPKILSTSDARTNNPPLKRDNELKEPH